METSRGEDDGEGAGGENDEEDEDESDDDDVHITIGDIKTGPAAYAPNNFNLKRGAAGPGGQGTGEKSKVNFFHYNCLLK